MIYGQPLGGRLLPGVAAIGAAAQENPSCQGQTQTSAGGALRDVLASPVKLSAIAAGSALLAVMLPVATISTGMGFGAVSESGGTVGGAWAWLAMLTFIAAAASRVVAGLRPHLTLLDIGALTLLGAATLWGCAYSPIAVAMHQSAANLAGMNSDLAQLPPELRAATGAIAAGVQVAVSPGIGLVFVFLAPMSLALAHRFRAIPQPAL